jgi:hypothetical protein
MTSERTAQFTPGPWHVSPTDEECHAVVSPQSAFEGQWFTAIVSCTDDATEDANAHLIAAAPGLYDALYKICREFAHGHPLIIAGKSVLTLARGGKP